MDRSDDREMLRTLSFLLLLTLPVYADDSTPAPTANPCKYDWLGLEKAWNDYLMDANPKTAELVVQGLHHSKEARENPQCEDRARIRKIFIEQAERLDKTIKMSGTRVPEIIQAMLAHMDAGFRQELEVKLGKTASSDPIGYAEMIRKKYNSKSCPFIDTDPEKFNDTDSPYVALSKTKKSLTFRMKQMKRVLGSRLAPAKNACVKVLERAIRKTDRDIAALEKKGKSK